MLWLSPIPTTSSASRITAIAGWITRTPGWLTARLSESLGAWSLRAMHPKQIVSAPF